MLHHLPLWVPDIERAAPSWRWLLGRLGYDAENVRENVLLFHDPNGFRLVLEQSADMVPGMLHSRLRPGLNHVALTVESTAELADIVAEAPNHGWAALPIDGHPIAADSEVAYLEDGDGFEIELVATPSG